jgi:hypothetical protein
MSENWSDYQFDYAVFVYNNEIDDVSFKDKYNDVKRYDVTRNTECKIIKDLLDSYDYVVFHSLFLNKRTKIFLRQKKYLDKIVWIEYGYDLYPLQTLPQKAVLRKIINGIMLFLFERRIKYFIAIHPADILAYKKNICGNANLYYAKYSFCEKIHSYNEKLEYENNELIVQIGHRALRSLNHIHWLKKLSKLKDNNLKVFIPLNYGDMQYAKKVRECALKLFGDRAIILDSVLPYDNYINILSKVSALILDSKRQIALGNISGFLRQGKKIFLPKDSVLYKYYTQNEVPVNSLDEINGTTSNIFANDDMSDCIKRIEYIKNYDKEDNDLAWRNAFDSIFKK